MISFRYTPQSLSIVNDENQQLHFDTPWKNNVISLKGTYLELEVDVELTWSNALYADGTHIRLVSLGPIALFSKFMLTLAREIR